MLGRLACIVALLMPVAAVDAEYGLRDVIDTAWLHPLVTDAEVVRYITDTRAVIESEGGQVLIRYPGITGVRVGDEPVAIALAGSDLLAVELSAGTHEVEVLTDGSPPPPAAIDLRAPAGRVADSPERFTQLAEAAGPGEEIVIADGFHRDWRVTVAASGTAGEPIVVRPQTPGGAIFRGNVRFQVTGSHVVLTGLRFEHCGPGITVHLEGANDSRVTQCQFFHCGNPRSTVGHILRVDLDTHRNRVDHCFFTGSKSMSLGQRISDEGPVGTDNRYENNIFRDIYRYWVNGQENIQLGQNQRDFGELESRSLVAGNLFDHAWGDSEIISSKSSRNVVRHNVAAYCRRAAFVLRGGDYTRFEGNVVYRCDGGVRVHGTNHEIVNNLLVDNYRFGVSLQTGILVGNQQVAADDTLVAHNTIVGSPQGIHAPAPTEDRPRMPMRCRILNNVVVSSGGRLMDIKSLRDEEIRRNLLWGHGTAEIGEAGEEAIVAEPLLTGQGAWLRPSEGSPAVGSALPLPEVTHDRLGRTRPAGPAPDLGAEEVGAAEPQVRVLLPPIPPAPLFEPGLYRDELLHAEDADEPMMLEDTGLALADGLPAEMVVRWRYRPAAWASVATVKLAGPGAEGWSLTWGGAADEGRPLSEIHLRDGSGALLASGTDVVYFYADFGPGYSGPPEPLEDRWYDFTLLLRDDEFYLLLGIEGREPVPVMVWKTHGEAVAGPLALSLEQQGLGWWREIEVHTLLTGPGHR